MKKDIRSYGYTELKKEMKHLGEKAFRAKQVYEWLHIKLADSFDEMTNLSLKLRERMKEEYEIFPVIMEERQISKLDGTNKFLFRLYDGNMVESVLMKYNTAILSAFPPRRAAGWGVCSARQRSEG